MTLWGESHGGGIRSRLMVYAPGCRFVRRISSDLDRRRSGAKGTTPRKESDTPRVVSGVFENYTTGAPLTILFENENTISRDYRNLTTHFRPSHSDRVADFKYGGYQDYRGGGHFSGRITLPLVQRGGGKQILGSGVSIQSELVELMGESDKSRFDSIIAEAISAHDSVNGVIECE